MFKKSIALMKNLFSNTSLSSTPKKYTKALQQDPFTLMQLRRARDSFISGYRGKYVGCSRLKVEQSAWYSNLTPDQKLHHYLTKRLSQYGLTKWNRAGCPGSDGMDYRGVLPYVGHSIARRFM